MRKQTFNLMLVIFILPLVSCITNYEIDKPEEPMLQIDAVLYGGKTFDPIKIRRVFKATGTQIDTIKSEDLWASGANVRLFHTSISTDQSPIPTDTVFIPTVEVEPGRHIPMNTSEIVSFDRQYGIQVRWNQLKASATAKVPFYDMITMQLTHQQIRAQPDTVSFIIGVIDPTGVDTEDRIFVQFYQSRISLVQELDSKFIAVQVATDTEIIAIREYFNYRQFVGDPLRYNNFVLDGTSNLFEYERTVYAYFPLGEESDGDQNILLRVVAVIPEDIYADYARVSSSFLLPATVTNVNDGVGLFIGARRDTMYIRIPLIL
jgi:hypothetical protein